jgi:signal transduction histidine kinase
MKTLALRIYLAVVAVLLVFALTSGWLAQHNMEHERAQLQTQAAWTERAAAWGELIENSLPPQTADEEEQARVFLDWAERLRIPMALDNAKGARVATAPMLDDLLERRPELRERLQSTQLADGRVLWVVRPGALRERLALGLIGNGPPPGLRAEQGPNSMGPPGDGPMGTGRPPHDRPWIAPLGWMVPPWLAHGLPALGLSLILLFVAVAVGAWPVVMRLTRRLQALRDGVEAFGQGQLQHRVAVEGADEVAALAASFNEAAQRVEDLVTANRSLLANASHELRSPLARLKMAVSIMGDMPPERAAQIKKEIHQDIRELDELVEELLLASRLETQPTVDHAPVDLISLLVDEGMRTGAQVDVSQAATVKPYQGDERLLRRAVRNLLENARRYGGSDVELTLTHSATGLNIAVADRGPGVPEDQRERIFEPFYRMPGHAEYAGGVGLGLSLVRQIMRQHNGQVRCEVRPGGGTVFTLALPLAAASA